MSFLGIKASPIRVSPALPVLIYGKVCGPCRRLFLAGTFMPKHVRLVELSLRPFTDGQPDRSLRSRLQKTPDSILKCNHPDRRCFWNRGLP